MFVQLADDTLPEKGREELLLVLKNRIDEIERMENGRVAANKQKNNATKNI